MIENIENIDPIILEKIQAIKAKFYWYAAISSVNHALNNLCTAYSTSILSPLLGAIIVGLNWSINSLSGLFLATPAVRRLGFKYSMILAMWGYAIQIATIYIAIVCDDITTVWSIAIIGSIIAGITSAIWWTAQGIFIQQVCTALAELLESAKTSTTNITITPNDAVQNDVLPENSSITSSNLSTMDIIQADISAEWTMIYLSMDLFIFLSLSFFPVVAGASIHAMFLALPILGVLSALLGHTFESLNPHEKIGTLTWEEYQHTVLAVPTQYSIDCRMALLVPYVFGFAFTTVMFAGYLNDVIVSRHLGVVELGFLVAFSDFTAIASALPYAYIARHYDQGLNSIMQFGTMLFILCGIVVVACNTDTLGQWSVMLVLKGLYGLGRGVFEGPCRATYAKFFHGDDLAVAFSSQTLFTGLGGGVAIVIFRFVSKNTIASVIIVNGCIALVAYSILMYVVDPRKRVSWGDFRRILCQCACVGRFDLQHPKLRKPLLQEQQQQDSIL